MNKITFKNYPDTTTPITADALNDIEDTLEIVYNYVSNRNKTLWTGTWTTGSITVTDSSKYSSFIVTAGNIPFACYKSSAGRVAGTSASSPGSGARYDRLFAASTSGDVWTIEWLKELTHNANGNHGAFGTSTITEIVGLDPIIENS